MTEFTKMEFLGSPVQNDTTTVCIVKKLSEFKRMNYRIILLDEPTDLSLLKNAFSLPRLPLSLRSVPCHHHPELLTEYDDVTNSTTEVQRNANFDDNSWWQAKLPVRYGGLELCSAMYLALPTFLSSRATSISMVNDIPHQPSNTTEDDDEVLTWLDRNLVLSYGTHNQRNWDDIHCSPVVAVFGPVLNQHRLACYKTVWRPESDV